jgi:multidrug resistance efflux pump
LKTLADVEITGQKIKEAIEDLTIARLNLQACEIKAPFSGFLAVRYKQPFETVDRLEKVFAILDSSKVYAVANVPETMLHRFPKDAEATFVHSSGKKFKGKVERLGKLIDPKSMTKRVHVLIDNPQNELEIGSSGTLESAD